MRHRNVLFGTFLILVLFALVSSFSPPAHAVIGLIVNTTDDNTTGSDTFCTLREAITNANSNSDTTGGDCSPGIAGTETITFSVSGTITLGSSLPGISDDLTIDGTGQTIIVSGNNAVRPLGVLSGKTLSLKSLTIANGYCSTGNGCGGGGGIFNNGTLNIANSTLSGNSAAVPSGFGGGAIFNNGGTVNIANSTLSGNSATGAGTRGGGIFNNTGGTVNIANSTLYGNSATDIGGGFVNFGTVNLKNSIFSANTASIGGDCYNNSGASISGSNNLVDNTSCSGSGSGSLGRIGAVSNFDTTLADNGGPTKTHKLSGGSNALEAVPSGQCTYVSSGTNPLFTNAATIATDQRDVIRPQNTTCDVGAYELLYCAAGSYDNGSGSCVLASQGYYVPTAGAIAATPCPPGTWQDQQGQTSCNLADPGYFVAGSGSQVQTQCPPGSNSPAAAVVCFQTGPSFVVNDASDTDDTACDALPGDCTLREAINAANANTPVADTITFDIPNGGACSPANTCTITLSALGTLPAINDNVTIDGSQNSADITVHGADLYRVFYINSGKTVEFKSFTITHGKIGNPGGAGIYNNGGLLTLTDMIVSNNLATRNAGGGIYSNNGALTITNSTLSDNRVDSTNDDGTIGGGAIFNNIGTLTITNSTFSGNYGEAAVGGGGGAISSSGATTVRNSTFTGNGPGNGTAIYMGDSTLEITNSTFSGQTGGAAITVVSAATVNIVNSTIANNSAGAGSGGIYNFSGTTTLKNTIVSGNTPADCYNSGTLNADASNLDSDGTCGGATQKTTGEINLAGLADNGGPTYTMALDPTSVAINAGNNSTCQSAVGSPSFGAGGLDQRGIARPQGLTCDVGAFELQYTPTQSGPNFVVNNAADTDDGSCDLLGQGIRNQDCTLREAVNAANALSGADTITFDATVFNPGTIALDNDLPEITTDLTITGLGETLVIVDGVDLHRPFNITAGTVAISSLTITRGYTNADGGGIFNDGGSITLDTMTLDANNADVYGGGIAHMSGSLIISNSKFTNNSSGDSGGAIFSQASLTINDSTLTDNSNGSSGNGDGGAIYNGVGGVLSANNDTFQGNKATYGWGGAIGSYGTGTITNSTFVSNQNTSPTTGGGGALDLNNTFSVVNSTFYGNSAAHIGAISIAANVDLINNTISDTTSGDAAVAIWSGGTVNLRNNIIANSITGADCDTTTYGGGTIGLNTNNLIEDGTCSPALTGDPQLGALQNNGGATDTMALGNSSVAIDAGDDAVCAASPVNALDQRGEARDDLNCDVGAFEFVDTDGNTISKQWNSGTDGSAFTFGPTLAEMFLGSGSPLTLVVKRQDIPTATPPGTPPANALPFLWDATTKESPFSLTVMLCYDPSVLTGQDENTLHVWHYNGSTWDDLGGGLNDSDYLPYHCVTAATPLTSLSPLLLAPGAPTATDVNGVKGLVNKNGNIVLRWKTTSESQIAGFNIYRQGKQGEWKQLNAKFRQAKHAGAALGGKYRFIDRQANADKTYRYKIEIVYLDGHTEWTNVIRVNLQ